MAEKIYGKNAISHRRRRSLVIRSALCSFVPEERTTDTASSNHRPCLVLGDVVLQRENAEAVLAFPDSRASLPLSTSQVASRVLSERDFFCTESLWPASNVPLDFSKVRLFF